MLGTSELYELGKTIRNAVISNDGLDCELRIQVDENHFKKIDEDLFYRLHEEGEDDFEPSDSEILLDFDKARIVIEKI